MGGNAIDRIVEFLAVDFQDLVVAGGDNALVVRKLPSIGFEVSATSSKAKPDLGVGQQRPPRCSTTSSISLRTSLTIFRGTMTPGMFSAPSGKEHLDPPGDGRRSPPRAGVAVFCRQR